MKIGLLGGTFDPPHIGHFVIAEEVYQQMELDEIWFIPSAEPPHKDRARVSAADRVAMLSAVIREQPHFKLNTLELDRKGKSYTIDTIKSLQQDFPEVTFYFIIGADMVEYLPKWHQIDQLLDLVKFVGVKRPEYQLETPYPIILLDIPGLDISSTMIRERLAQKRSVQYLVPKPVINVIRERGLYGQK
ncbi:nicotinate-nucleotide adenylyltransferase [Amphibacillus sediminis]|uniref:nicotinate-nucleotide adenylyltransferase n=1 Tax=Amphibacillus sediminis TaxID=360185 RepID=UPI000A470945